MTVSDTATDRTTSVERILPRLLSPRGSLLVSIPALALVLTWMVLRYGGHQLDLEVYGLGVHTWLDGGDMYGSLPPTTSGRVLPFIYPPFAAMLLTPLVLLPWTAAWIALFVLSLGSLAATVSVVVRRMWPVGGRAGALVVTVAALPPALLLEPVLQTVMFGQVNLILMALVALDALVDDPRWPRGMLVGVAAAVKLTPAVFVLYFLLRRDARAAAVAAVTAAVATGVGFLVDAEASARYWFDGPAAGVSGSAFFTNETVQAVLTRLGVGEPVFTVVWLAVTLGLLGLLVPVVRRGDRAVAVVAVAGFGLVASPTSWSHHWVWIVPALVVAVGHALRARSKGWAVVAGVLAVTFFLAPFRFLTHDDGRELAWSGWEQVVGATYLIVAMALLAVGWWRYGWRTGQSGRPGPTPRSPFGQPEPTESRFRVPHR